MTTVEWSHIHMGKAGSFACQRWRNAVARGGGVQCRKPAPRALTLATPHPAPRAHTPHLQQRLQPATLSVATPSPAVALRTGSRATSPRSQHCPASLPPQLSNARQRYIGRGEDTLERKRGAGGARQRGRYRSGSNFCCDTWSFFSTIYFRNFFPPPRPAPAAAPARAAAGPARPPQPTRGWRVKAQPIHGTRIT